MKRLQSKWALGHFDPSMNRRGATSAFRFESARTRLSYARMKRACLVLGLVVVLGCDEDKRKADLLAKTAPSASVAQPILSAAPSAAPAPSTKPPRECPTGDEVTITDPEIESEVRAKAKKPAPTPLTAKDLATVTSIRINARKGAPLEELDPCVFPKLTSLRFLYLPNGSYRDLSPISNLTRLEGLFFPDSEVEDLKPLAKLTLLDQIGMPKSHVRDIGTLANLVNLTELTLDDTQVSDLGPLASCTKLMNLSIKNTLVKDLSPLKALKSLKKLNLAGTAVDNLDVLAPLRAGGLKILQN